jgi:hypothetical protein
MAYALNLSSDGWLWGENWGAQPTDAQLTSTMTSYGYSLQSQTMFANAQIIYYSGGHFSKVFAWDSVTGMPLAIRSKWGGLELIISYDPDPFTGVSYGSAYYYFKKP